jgi:uncharacterized membrane protein
LLDKLLATEYYSIKQLFEDSDPRQIQEISVMTLANVVLIAAGTLTGLFAGLLYAFSVAVVPALRAIKGTAHVSAAQSINLKIINPVFMLSFLGPVVLLPLAAFLHRDTPQFGPLVAASILDIIGAVGVTVAGNVPLNNKLDKIDVSTLSEAEADQIRNEYQGPGSPWMRFHAIRTLVATAATAIVFIVCLSKNGR